MYVSRHAIRLAFISQDAGAEVPSVCKMFVTIKKQPRADDVNTKKNSCKSTSPTLPLRFYSNGNCNFIRTVFQKPKNKNEKNRKKNTVFFVNVHDFEIVCSAQGSSP